MKRLHATISGRVQGVWFRASAVDQARELGLVGWVRNLPDGRVELVAEGPQADLEALEKWCHRGPPLAQVREVLAQWLDAEGQFLGFRILGN